MQSYMHMFMFIIPVTEHELNLLQGSRSFWLICPCCFVKARSCLEKLFLSNHLIKSCPVSRSVYINIFFLKLSEIYSCCEES